MRDILHRLSRLERVTGLLPPDDPQPMLIRVAGGPGALDSLHAIMDARRRLDAYADEDQAAFEARALDEAADIGAAFVVVNTPG